MNFTGYLMLHISCLKDYESFTFIIDFWKSRKYEGMYADGFPMLRYFCYVFHQKLDEYHPSLSKRIKIIEMLDEYWIMKWFM